MSGHFLPAAQSDRSAYQRIRCAGFVLKNVIRQKMRKEGQKTVGALHRLLPFFRHGADGV
jgi:hypothetical protein